MQKMHLTEADIIETSKLIAELGEYVTCLECCKHYKSPETAPCGHMLCHTCWRWQRSCPTCKAPLDKKKLKPDNMMGNLTVLMLSLRKSFEILFKKNLDEILMESESCTIPTQNVNNWLTSSQIHSSAPSSQPSCSRPSSSQPTSSQPSSSQPSSSQPAEPNTEAVTNEGIFVNDNCTIKNPCRSSKKKRNKNDDYSPNTNKVSLNKPSYKSSTDEIDKETSKVKNDWNNVKKNRKEHSKLNKINRNKLNVSIEMFKEAQRATKKNLNNNSNTSSSVTNNDNIEIAATVDNKSNNSNDVEEDNRNEQSTNEVFKVANINDKNYSIDGNQCDISSPKNINEEISYSHNCSRAKTPFLKKSSLHNNYNVTVAHEKTNNEVSSINNATSESDDIFISIKIGNKTANITFKKSQNNVQVKENTDQETQTSFDQNLLRKDAAVLSLTNTVHKGSSNNASTQTSTINKEITKNDKIQQVQNILDKSVSVDKLPASADTATVQFKITESVEKELSSIMECGMANDVENVQPQQEAIIGEETNVDMCTTTQRTDYLNDLDISKYGSVKEKISSEEPQVQLLKNTEKASSKIMISLKSNKHKTLKISEKMNRDIIVTNHELPLAKKQKTCNTRIDLVKEIEQHSEPINSDALMGQVFANIDSDIEDIKQSQISNKNTKQKSNSQKISGVSSKIQCINKVQRNSSEIEANKYKYGENVFSISAKESHDLVTEEKNTETEINETPVQIEINNMSIRYKPREVIGEHANVPPDDVDFCITIEDEESYKSAVEVTPQKTSSFAKPIPNNNAKTTETLKANTENLTETKDKYSDSSLEIQIVKSAIINITDSMNVSKETVKDVTTIQAETNVTINEFVNQIQHKSTPVQSNGRSEEILCITGSCLSATKIALIKALCKARGWTYSNKYVKELTHLVVDVDEENKSRRSVKYMSALAAGKWIVNYTWINNCLQSNNIANEELYEVLDWTGDPGPRLSRTAQKKIFEGISFFCMPPFTQIDIETLKEILEAAGGTLLRSVEAARVTADCPRPVLLLAEPEDTQDRFIYIAIELNIVPVHFEWAFNCLGSYTLESIQELLLCPSVLLPAATSRWPECLLASIDSE